MMKNPISQFPLIQMKFFLPWMSEKLFHAYARCTVYLILLEFYFSADTMDCRETASCKVGNDVDFVVTWNFFSL